MNQLTRILSVVGISVAATTVLLTSPIAVAQSNSADTIEEVLVTGSRIKRRDEDSASPIQTLNEEDLRVDGSLSIGETLQALPSVGSSLNSNGSAGTSHGSSSLNLRHLGANRSLVLVNGHRWVNGAGTRGFRDFVDLNTIPQAMIERVEVLQDGATAIYGADAISGVVNMHTYQNFEGLRAKAYFGASSESDRETTGLDLLIGRSFGRSNITLAATYVDQEPIYTQDRALTAIPLNGLPLGTPEGLFRETNLNAVVGFPVPTEGITRDPGVDGSVVGNWRAADAATDRYNRYADNYVVGPLERLSLFLQGTTEFDNGVSASVELLYNNRKSDQQFSAVPPVLRGSRGFAIANDPSVNPFGVEFSGSDFRVDNFFNDNQLRVNEQDVDTFRIGFGLAGEFANGWSWDAFASTAENEGKFTSRNQMDLDKLALGMLACDTSGIVGDVSDIAAGCVPVNLFNPLTPAMIDYINFTGNDVNKAEQTDFTFNVTGDLLDMPAGPLGFAAGVEYREERGTDVPDATIASDPRINTYRRTTSAPRDGTNGKYDLSELYVEFDVPLLTDRPMARELSLQAATRYSDYSTFGGTTNSKLGVLYRPADSVLLRGTWAEGFRAPSVLELFEGSRATSVPVIDPCSGGGAGLPGCAGVPATYVQNAANASATVGGNPALQPETSENLSLGMVLSADLLAGASLTVDWYNIEIEDTISAYGAQDLLDLCATSGQRCNFITRESSGEIANVVDGPINLNNTEVEGIDIVGRLSSDVAAGKLDLTLSLSRLLDLVEVSTLTDGSTLTEDKVGTAASREAYPEWRGMLTARWTRDQWSGNYSARWIGDTTEMASGTPRRIPSVVYHNIAGIYQVNDALQVRLGIDNLADKQPPASLTNTNINFDQNTYSAVGRFVYLQLSYDAAW